MSTNIGDKTAISVVNGRLATPASPQLSKTVDPLGTFAGKEITRTGEFFRAFGPRAASTLLMHVGTPVIAVTTPALLERFGGDFKNNLPANLVAGSALGGAWGAIVGAAIPLDYAGVRIPRVRAMGLGAASGVVLAPAVSVASRMVVNWFASPLGEAAGETNSGR